MREGNSIITWSPAKQESVERKVLFYKKDRTIPRSKMEPSSLKELCQHLKGLCTWSKKKIVQQMLKTDIWDIEGVTFSMNKELLK